MRYLAILGSHERTGITAGYLDAVLQALPQDAQVETVWLRDYQIYPDTKAKTCPALDQIEAKMAASDFWILCTPTYWGGPSGVMKQFFDCMRFRLVRMTSAGDTLPGKYKDKHYLSMTTCFISSLDNFFTGITDQTFVTIDRVMTGAGLIKVGEFVGTGTWGTKAPRPEKVAECQRWGRKIADRPRKDDNTLKRYLLLFVMIAAMALVTMGLQAWWLGVFAPGKFWMTYISFVVIFYVLLAGLLHFFTFVRHRRR
ncbi:MAG TPA: flavodoxin family protein [Candidatus Levilactobacillus faecigallinarum]|uniref:Flavodoxin family protein n=1 Tax=Candidatus Levilactobacillus faecigallinarum TaxID=2838638 RepID=A0A9D1QRS5_9LACO|nr:flavodoxin family protein [Candidatus Levilactobacillus faecigallinarum]